MLCQKAVIQLKNGPLPLPFSEIGLVILQKRLLLFRRIRIVSSIYLILHLRHEVLRQLVQLVRKRQVIKLLKQPLNGASGHQQVVCLLCIDVLQRNIAPLVAPAKRFQIMKPGKAAFYAGCFIFPLQFFNRIFPIIPVLIQKTRKQLLHRHL